VQGATANMHKKIYDFYNIFVITYEKSVTFTK